MKDSSLRTIFLIFFCVCFFFCFLHGFFLRGAERKCTPSEARKRKSAKKMEIGFIPVLAGVLLLLFCGLLIWTRIRPVCPRGYIVGVKCKGVFDKIFEFPGLLWPGEKVFIPPWSYTKTRQAPTQRWLIPKLEQAIDLDEVQLHCRDEKFISFRPTIWFRPDILGNAANNFMMKTMTIDIHKHLIETFLAELPAFERMYNSSELYPYHDKGEPARALTTWMDRHARALGLHIWIEVHFIKELTPSQAASNDKEAAKAARTRRNISSLRQQRDEAHLALVKTIFASQQRFTVGMPVVKTKVSKEVKETKNSD